MSSMLLAAAAAAVATVPTVTADEALAKAKTFFSVTPHRRAPCPVATGNDIVVCRELEDPATQYVPSNTDNGDTYDGQVHAPDVSSLPQGGMRIGRKPRDPLIIDLSSIPEPPPGSDADKIAKGEKAAP